MRIDLIRSFSSVSERDEDSEDWLRYLRKSAGQYDWSDLHQHRVVVVLGEAGIGKTLEFQNEVDRLRRDGKTAFFIPLNLVLDEGSWNLVVLQSQTAFEQWEKSTNIGYFFLDAVDEARLINHAALERALMVIATGLRPYFSRVRFAISSRITDWAVESVRESVHRLLTVPIEAASRIVDAGELGDGALGPSTVPRETSADSVNAFVVSLDPLSQAEARKLADAFGVRDPAAFWSAIEDGDYEFMATRPLDLGWMVNLWNVKHGLGSYLELLDANVSNRLRDVNPSYQQAGASLSLDMLQSGAEQLAAASEFSGQPFVSTTHSVASDEIAPSAILSDWKPAEIARLVGSAVFDEATFGRVKFHHRSIREYLAASWVNRQVKLGVPLHRMLPFFTAAPFGLAVLIPSRRATLCWLAALNVQVREWITREFPEMLLFEGDPEAWDVVTANLAFMAYVERIRKGLRTDWWNDASEFRRLARRLPPGRVAQLLAEQEPNSRVTAALLPLVKHGRLMDCGQVVFDMYRRAESSARQRHYALATLTTIASAAHRASVKEDLLQERLQSNELIAAALSVTDWANLTVDELVQVFRASGSESAYGPMARAVKEELLPGSSVASAELLLTAVVEALPAPKDGKRFARFPEAEQPERAWLLDVLSDCTERLLSLLPPGSEQFPEICVEAAERVEAIRYSGFADREDQQKLYDLIAERPALRWRIALEIAESEEIRHATSRLTWGGNCLVSFNKTDLPELMVRANDSSATAGTRDIWFDVGMNLAFRELKGRSRRKTLAALSSGPDHEKRIERINRLHSEWVAGLRQRRQYKMEERKRKREKRQAHDRNRENLKQDIEHIRDASYAGTLHWLISYSYDNSGRESLTRVDFSTISQAFGNDVAEALASGLIIASRKIEPPNPADYPGGQVPWDAITALAGLHALLERGTDIAALSNEDAARAALLAVWELNGPPRWFDRLAVAHENAVIAALSPWVEAECISPSDAHRTRGALELTLRASPSIRARLLNRTVKLVHEDRIGNRDTLKSLVDALRQNGLLAAKDAAAIYRAKIETELTPERFVSEFAWLRSWLEDDFEGAWTWIENHIASLGVQAAKQVDALARGLIDGKWIREPLGEANAGALIRMYRLLSAHSGDTRGEGVNKEDGALGPPITRLKESIPRMLVQLRGAAANRALVDLANQESEPIVKEWLEARIVEHAALEAQHFAPIEPNRLQALGEPFRFEPRSERQLFQQALGRLEEIRKAIEEGPFSDRLLFSLGIPEKHLQLWLAARFLDTTNRRFSVHREEVVDADNRTDLQLSCPHGNVCVEIKPLDKTRRYSAISLVDTMRTQIVGQYLKGFNSAHGILVLCRLDEKIWTIPGETKGRDFNGLLAYLRDQAESVKRDYPAIEALEVFGIDCVG